MQFALYNSEKKEAEPDLKGLCPHCNLPVIAKCGAKNIWHWAHLKAEDCDSWSEPETLWHRAWKKQFGSVYSEIRVQKEVVYHIADVINKNGIVFEFQNSPISEEVIKIREAFYGEKMMWVMNGFAFKENFELYEEDFIKLWKFTPLDQFAAANYRELKNALIIEDWQVKLDLVKDFLKTNGFVYHSAEKVYSLNLNTFKYSNKEQFCFKLTNDLLTLYDNHKQSGHSTKAEFIWEHCRRSWQEAKRPVFIDFGENFLFYVTTGIGKKYGTGIKILKTKFFEKYC